jgi:AcrR family transcriptional regulator
MSSKKAKEPVRGSRAYTLGERARRQAETRERIAAAMAQLHEEVGPAKTTIAEVARRAGVQRPTVYNNFPEERQLLAACQGHFLAEHPPPDPGPALALSDPAERARQALSQVYVWFRETAAMTGNVQRDRRQMPELDALLAQGSDRQLDELADALSAGFGRQGAAAMRTRATLRLALDFSTWERLSGEGLADSAAAELMVAAAAAAG